MKILHVLAQLPYGTGSGIYFSNLIKALARYDHDQAAVFALQDQAEFDLLPGDRQYPVRFKTDDLPFPVPGMSDIMPYDSTRYSDMTPDMLARWRSAFKRAMNRAAVEFQPDALILHHLWILTSLAVETFPHTKSIGICHYTDLRQCFLNPRLKEGQAPNIHRLNTILSLSEGHHDEIIQVHSCEKSKVITMGGGFDDALFYPKAKPARQRVKILYAGKIDPSKGVFALVEAFSSLNRRDEDMELSIIGNPSPDHGGQLEKLIKNVDNIHLYPAMSQGQLADAMREHDVFVLPSLFEGLGLIAIEALASGLWTVATEIEGLISLLGSRVADSGVIEFVPVHDVCNPDRFTDTQPEELVNGLEVKLKVQVSRAREGRGFPKWVSAELAQHSWAGIASKVNDILNQQ